MCTLMIPDITLADEIRAYRRAFLAAGDSIDGTGSLRRRENPADWIADNIQCSRRETAPKNFVPATQFVYLREDGKIVGMLQVRHELNGYLAVYGGHIGYSVHPDHRRKGYAAQMLRDALPYCREIGLDRVLITCNAKNEGSRRTIVKNGGVYDGTAHEPNEDVDIERYWISLGNKEEEQ